MTTFYQPTRFQWAAFGFYALSVWCVLYAITPDWIDISAMDRIPKLDVAYPMPSLVLAFLAFVTIHCFPS